MNVEPFGSADANREDLAQLREDFVEFSPLFPGLSLQDGDIKTRVIVGKKGAGKTAYLRRAQAFAADSNDLYTTPTPHDPPTTRHVVRVRDLLSTRPQGVERLVETWSGIWKAAVLRSILSHLRHDPRLSTPASERIAESIWADYPELCPPELDPFSVYGQVRAIIDGTPSGPRLEEFISDYRWEAVQNRTTLALESCPPVCLYLDAIDEEYRHAPQQWLACQKGLFYQVMKLNRAEISNRLHIVICVRDHVYASVRESEHATRYIDPTYIRNLSWNWDAADFLLSSKIRRLDESQLISPDANQSLSRWLGSDKIFNHVKGQEESLQDYLIRHTRSIPRDIIILGNMLSMEVSRSKLQSDGTRTVKPRIQEIVAEASKLFGKEQLAICANHLAADSMPDRATLWDGSDLYTGTPDEEEELLSEASWNSITFNELERAYEFLDLEDYSGNDPSVLSRQAYQKTMSDRLKTTLKRIGRDRFERKTFLEAKSRANELSDNSDVMTILWLGGLLGFVDGEPLTGPATFFGDREDSPMLVPDDMDGYALHPCLVDYVGLEGIGKPVEPHRLQI